MAKMIEVEYLAEQNVLKLPEPLAGVRDHAKLAIEIKELSPQNGRPWLALAGSLDLESGRELARTTMRPPSLRATSLPDFRRPGERLETPGRL